MPIRNVGPVFGIQAPSYWRVRYTGRFMGAAIKGAYLDYTHKREAIRVAKGLVRIGTKDVRVVRVTVTESVRWKPKGGA
jgi:hypothetical protein